MDKFSIHSETGQNFFFRETSDQSLAGNYFVTVEAELSHYSDHKKVRRTKF